MDAQRGQTLPRLVEVMQRLLAPDGCPWDRTQTLETLRAYVIEEAFEVVDAIDRGSKEHLREELGDLLLQIVFQSELARAKGWFGPDDVITAICDKLVRRHPHVFGETAGGRAESTQGRAGEALGDEKVGDAAAALGSWERLKLEEKKDRGALDGVPVALPALLRAVRVGEKASAVGYDWPDLAGVRSKVDEELAELDEAVASGDLERAEAELGDVLFALASFARKEQLDPEAALRKSLARFSSRFSAVEARARASGNRLHDMSAGELDALWQQAKREVG